MQLDPQEAINYGFVTDRNGNRISSSDYSCKSSVDLNIREVLVKDRKNDRVIRSPGAVLGPQESAYLISEEYINVPDGYVAYVFLKNRLSQNGLLAFNTGIIDSGYYGPISTLIINLSQIDQPVPDMSMRIGRAFFRVVFQKIGQEDSSFTPIFNSEKKDYEKYCSFRQGELINLPRNFLDPEKLKKEIDSELTEKISSFSIMRLGLVVATVGILLSLLPLGRDYYFSEKFDFLSIRYESEQAKEDVSELKEEVSRLKLSLLNLTDKHELNTLKSEVETIREMIESKSKDKTGSLSSEPPVN
ncbi:dCTP deaminase domain-containing protein [Photobacterium indicum]|uniref:dCTP deaminase domain-containing protein n=1 Tax=Photobacterium indicum TaxID=81447 RepID=UPI003D14C3F8